MYTRNMGQVENNLSDKYTEWGMIIRLRITVETVMSDLVQTEFK